jgi:hypothetical protein
LSSSRKPVDIKWGERTVTIKCDRDFDSRTEYDAFKAYTATDITILATKSVNNSVQIKSAVTIKNSYEVNLSGQGDLVRGTVEYVAEYDPATSKAYEIVVKTQEVIT